MSVCYKAVQWNSHKLVYDVVLILGIILYIVSFFIISSVVLPGERAIHGMTLEPIPKPFSMLCV